MSSLTSSFYRNKERIEGPAVLVCVCDHVSRVPVFVFLWVISTTLWVHANRSSDHDLSYTPPHTSNPKLLQLNQTRFFFA